MTISNLLLQIIRDTSNRINIPPLRKNVSICYNFFLGKNDEFGLCNRSPVLRKEAVDLVVGG